jgi:hypothetical protein
MRGKASTDWYGCEALANADSCMPFEEVNDFRMSLGLGPIIQKKTACLCCARHFTSRDYPRQRLCEECRSEGGSIISLNAVQDSMTADYQPTMKEQHT